MEEDVRSLIGPEEDDYSHIEDDITKHDSVEDDLDAASGDEDDLGSICEEDDEVFVNNLTLAQYQSFKEVKSLTLKNNYGYTRPTGCPIIIARSALITQINRSGNNNGTSCTIRARN